MSDAAERLEPDAEPKQELVLVIPETAILPDRATFYDGPDDKRCRLIRPDGERCRSTRMRAYGLCSGHAGVGGVARDPVGSSALGNAERRRRSETRISLGISGRRAAQPLQQARMAAQTRALDYAKAIVDDPLDDGELGTIPRQQAAIRALELLYPQVTAHLDVSMPDDAEQMPSMSWQGMQALASRLLEPGDQQ